jgi:hypothetical protein
LHSFEKTSGTAAVGIGHDEDRGIHRLRREGRQ